MLLNYTMLVNLDRLGLKVFVELVGDDCEYKNLVDADWEPVIVPFSESPRDRFAKGLKRAARKWKRDKLSADSQKAAKAKWLRNAVKRYGHSTTRTAEGWLKNPPAPEQVWNKRLKEHPILAKAYPKQYGLYGDPKFWHNDEVVAISTRINHGICGGQGFRSIFASEYVDVITDIRFKMHLPSLGVPQGSWLVTVPEVEEPVSASVRLYGPSNESSRINTEISIQDLHTFDHINYVLEAILTCHESAQYTGFCGLGLEEQW